MEAIFELLMNNFLFIALLIGGLISVFNRNKQQEEANKKTKQEDTNRKEIDWKTIFQQESDPNDVPGQRRPTKPVPEAEAELVKPENQEISKKHEQYKERIEELRKKRETAEEKMKNIEASPVFEEGIGDVPIAQQSGNISRSRFATISRKEAINGIIWSEILSEPKARRPHVNNFHRKYYKKS
ncbi:hypothetical protein [Alteribacillus bidgolensis]|uniref:Uncharacterized protein n=1 Tax=Alteribacillus bidgolensis TaxID=930129 RepID=A0A1G8P088_9BACI|nr:hypothetical protein [Alteribacillus bidgolensis]SDI85658.1 hypothetical protein SAMN05216352_11354 [Alteribacillus bidgolensis]